eukprot:TRINITY_DN30954_c0_g1_i1.p1 TRINITY_DN30954_c0_g1~~TRINITY_DN30954_c0_g1_i1.p1  ORF type:complete len:295 (-),score=18.87 TRINITY_DN30954_c0_g1_i1:31-795(-)
MATSGESTLNFTGLPEEIQMSVLFYLGVVDLCRFSEVSVSCRILASDDALWKENCARRWRNKKRQPLQIYPQYEEKNPVSFLSDREISALSISQLKSQLRQHGVSESRIDSCFEKSDLKRLLKQVITTKKKTRISPWKRSYFFAERDAQRCQIKMEEITSIDWIFNFKREFGFWGGHADVNASARFHPDGTYTSELFNIAHSWRLIGEYVQVAQYPYLAANRTPDWGWELQNQNVIFGEAEPMEKNNDEKTDEI